jgi:hypothetical protein
MVEKVISFFDFDTTVSIRLFLGFFGRKMVHCIKLGKPISSSFQKILNAKWHNASKRLLKKQKPFCNIINEIWSIFGKLEHRWHVLYSFLNFKEKE